MFQKSNLNVNSYLINIDQDDKTKFNESNTFLGFSLKKDLLNDEISSTLLKYLRIKAYAMSANYFLIT